jgi:hypothetical protein
MKIAILGWGSLVWKPGSLSTKGVWNPNGPRLPVEFARISKGDAGPRLTLVLVPDVSDVTTLWIESSCPSREEAMQDLARREGVSTIDRVGYVEAGEGALSTRSRLGSIVAAEPATGGARQKEVLTLQLLERIDRWRQLLRIDAVIWTDLASNFEAKAGHGAFTAANAASYLQGLRDSGSAAEAKEYIRRAPSQVRTAVRDEVEAELGWTPLPLPITTSDDLRFKDWTECRASIGRFDAILVDLRKLGFSFITGLLAAGSFLSVSNASASQAGVIGPLIRVVPFMILMLLTLALSLLDNYFEALLNGAVERALDLEAQMDPPVRVSKYITVNAMETGATRWLQILYRIFIGIAAGLGLLAAWEGSPNPEAAGSISVLLITIWLLLDKWRAENWDRVRQRTNPDRLKADRTWLPGESRERKMATPEVGEALPPASEDSVLPATRQS